MTGYIFDHRKELESDVWLLPPMYHRVWQWIKYMVNHSEAKIPNKDGTFTIIKPGQHATSYRHIAKGVGYYEGLKWKEPNPKTIKTILNWLESQEMISVKGNTNGTVVTVENWSVYQKESVKGNTKGITDKQSLDTNKNDKEELRKKTPSKWSEESNEFRLSLYLYNYMIKNDPSAKKPNLQSWASEMDKVIRLDNRDVEEIKKVIKFCQKDSFWYKNILSVGKLRKQYDQLRLKMNDVKPEIKDNRNGVEIIECF